jgi:hypothetical protein
MNPLISVMNPPNDVANAQSPRFPNDSREVRGEFFLQLAAAIV